MPVFLKLEITESELHGYLWIVDRIAHHRCCCDKCLAEQPGAFEAFQKFNQKVVDTFERRMKN